LKIGCVNKEDFLNTHNITEKYFEELFNDLIKERLIKPFGQLNKNLIEVPAQVTEYGLRIGKIKFS